MQRRTIELRTAWQWAAILVMGQLLISQWTVRAAGQRDVLDYISFAGTITSMLLAVLAIVYSYYTTASQKSDADRIATQISTLSSTVLTLGESERRLSDELIRLTEIRAQLDIVGDRVNSTSEVSVQTRESVELLRTELATKITVAQEKATAPEVGDHSSDSITKIIADAVDSQCAALFAAYKRIGNDELKIMEVVEKFILPFEINPSGFSKYVSFGEVYAYVLVMLRLNVRGNGSGNDSVFIQALKSRVKDLPEKDDEMYVWSKLTASLKAELAVVPSLGA